jgi:hypothetical protein
MKKTSLISIVCVMICGIALPTSALAVVIEPPGGGGPRDPYKIGVFFYNTDTCWTSVINGWKGILQLEGYTKFYTYTDFKDLHSKFTTIDNLEQSQDTVFVYIAGHGATGYVIDDNGDPLYSLDLKNELRRLETPRIGVLVDACQAQTFQIHLNYEGYLVMVSSFYMNAYLSPDYSRGLFSYYFWLNVEIGSSATQAFNGARDRNSWGWYSIPPYFGSWDWQEPKIDNELTSYSFFA